VIGFCLILQILRVPRAPCNPPGRLQKCIKNAIKFKSLQNSEIMAEMKAKGCSRNVETRENQLENRKNLYYFSNALECDIACIWTARVGAQCPIYTVNTNVFCELSFFAFIVENSSRNMESEALGDHFGH